MSQLTANTLLESGAQQLDRLRRVVLRRLLEIDPLRVVYFDPARRGLLLFCISCALALAFALVAPLWQLLLGPMLFGLAHLLSTVRFVPRALEGRRALLGDDRRERAIQVILCCAAFYALCRWAANTEAIGPRFSEWQGLALLDGGYVLLLFSFLAILFQRSKGRSLGGALLLTGAVSCFWFAPAVSAGALVLLHHLIAFVYWIALAKDERGRSYGHLALALFLGVNALLFLGLFDPLLAFFVEESSIGFAGMTAESLGKMILPWTDDPRLWLRATVAFAFGQSLHYFIWLKAIPDECCGRRVPSTFRASVRSLEGDFGLRGAGLLLGSVLGLSLLWVLVELPAARAGYFLLAGFHGLGELAALPLLRRRIDQRKSRDAATVAPLATTAKNSARGTRRPSTRL
jgi:hypothetical protein